MDLKLKTFESMTTTPRYGNYCVEVAITGVHASDIIENLTEEERKELIKHIPYSEVIEYHGHEEILNEIGIDKIKEYLKEYHVEDEDL